MIASCSAVTTHVTKTNNRKKDSEIVCYFKSLDESTQWVLVDSIKQNFRTYHPQGMVKIGDFYYLSSVEQIIKPEKLDPYKNKYDRTPGSGIGHLFKIDQKGNLVALTTLGEGTIYHPGGIDYDGEYIWIAVAEYRPHSKSIIYRVNPTNLEAEKMFYFDDHIGCLVYNKLKHELHGMNWGSRRFYIWKLDNLINKPDISNFSTLQFKTKLNGNYYIDYQDCHYLTDKYMLCSGLKKYSIPNLGTIAIGGLELVDLETHIPVHQISVNSWIMPDIVMTQNPFYFEMVNHHLRFYFMPEDDESMLYIFEAIRAE